MVAIDIETTGPVVSQDELYQLSIMPLNSKLEYDKSRRFLNLFIRPECKTFIARENTGRKERFIQAKLHGLEKQTALEVIDKWADSLDIRQPGMIRNKKLMPLTHNWAWKRAFLVDFLGLEFFDDLFHWHARDLIVAGAFCNDRAEFRGDDEHFLKLTLASLSSKLEVKNPYPDDPAQDVQHFAALYRAMILWPLGEIV
jgi:hypothetical protein